MPAPRHAAARLAVGLAALVAVVACADPATAPLPTPASTLTARAATRTLAPTDLGVVGEAYAIGPDGRVVGFVFVPAVGAIRAALWEDGALTILPAPSGVPDAIESWATAINPRGQVVGVVQYLNGTKVVGVLWQDGVPTVLPTGGAASSEAWAINPAGDIAGAVGTHAVMWRGGQSVVDLGTLAGGPTSTARGINARRQVVGCALVPTGGVHAFLWEQGTMRDLGTLAGRRNSCATAINARGQVVGWSANEDADMRGFLWEDGVMTDLGVLPGWTRSFAAAINARGQVVGWSERPGGTRAFLWEDGVMTDLGAGVSLATGINASGQVVGRTGANWALWTFR